MKDTIGNITQLTDTPTTEKDPFSKFLGESMDVSFQNGFELARVRILRILDEQGIKREVIHRVEQIMPTL